LAAAAEAAAEAFILNEDGPELIARGARAEIRAPCDCLRAFIFTSFFSLSAMSDASNRAGNPWASGDGSVAAAEDAVRALWSALDRLDHSLTYLLPENSEDALFGESGCAPRGRRV
jgi:hypothetical protein